MLQYVCNSEGIRIPWDKVAQGLGTEFTDGAIVQHLAKLRGRMADLGFSVPPPLRRGVTQAPSRVYAVGNRGGAPRLIPSPARAKAQKQLLHKGKANKSRVYKDTTTDESSDENPEIKKPVSAAKRGRKSKASVVKSIEIKKEEPRRSSTRAPRKDYTKMEDDESDDEELSEADSIQENDAASEPGPEDDEYIDNAVTTEEKNSAGSTESIVSDVKPERSATVSPITSTRPSKIVKLSVAKRESPIVFPEALTPLSSAMLASPIAVAVNTTGSNFPMGETRFPASAYTTVAPAPWAPAYASTGFDYGYNNTSSFNPGHQFGSGLPPGRNFENTFGDETVVPDRGYGSFSTEVTTSTDMTTSADMGNWSLAPAFAPHVPENNEGIYSGSWSETYAGPYGVPSAAGGSNPDPQGIPNAEQALGEFSDLVDDAGELDNTCKSLKSRG